jgi:hypothetical protein
VDNTTWIFNMLFAGMAFGCVGSGAWMYGKRRSSAPHMIIGAILIIYPYFTGNVMVLYGVGVVLTVALFLFKAS